jgi:hypothetical protein
MAQTSVFKNNFTSGALDPRLHSRLDIAHYENGAETLDNVVVMPYGGLRRRGGLRSIYHLPIDAGGNAMLARFAYNSTDQQYLLCFSEQRVYFFRDSQVIENINGTGLDYLVSPWPVSVARDLKWSQTADTMIIVHEDYAPYKLVRGSTDATWTLAAISFDAQPQIDYNDASSPTPVSEVQDITLTTFTTGNTFKLDLENVLTESITYDASSTSSTADRIQKALANLYVVRSGEVSCAYTSGTTYRVTFSGGSAKDYQTMTGFATSGTGTIAITQITAGSVRTENAWSATRGWPKSVCFYESRLVFGGSKSKPATVFLSKSNGYYDFGLGSGLADDGIQKTLDTDQVNAIVNVVPGRHLMIFTEGGEFFVPDFPITPENSNFRPQTTFGCATPDPIELEGAVLFLDRYARGLQQFLYNDVEAAYTANSISRLSGHIIDTPLDMDVQRSSALEDTNLVYLINNDGTAAVLNHLRAESIAAWTRFVTDGAFLSVSSLGEEVYFLVRRSGSTGAAWSIEHLRDDFYTDDAEQYFTGAILLESGDYILAEDGDTILLEVSAAGTTWTVGTHLDGIECRVRGDGAVMENVTPSGGSITLSAEVTEIEIGRNFNTTMTTLPVSMNSARFGMSQLQRTRIAKILTRVKSTQGLLVNGRSPRQRKMDVDPLDTAVGLYSGVLENYSTGFGRLKNITFTQEDPLPLQLLAIEYLAEING